jgi:putative heme iron utilization protein
MAINKNHQMHIDMMNAFETADRNTPRDSVGRASYGMAQSSGLPRSPAQMQSVKKAAQKSALARGERASLARSPAAPLTAKPAAMVAPSSLVKPPGISTGSLSIAKPKKGLLSL